MSATRLSVLFVALGVSLSLAAECRAQAYGAEVIVENNDLRWFEPIELDLDGRLSRDRRGLSFKIEKLAWDIAGERVEIGAPNQVNPSEIIYEPNPTVVVQDQVNDLAATGLDPELIFEILNTEYQTDGGTGTSMGVPPAGEMIIFDTIDTGETDDMDNPITFESPRIIPGTGDQPPPLYNIENSILDAVPDADFAWGERYELSYSDGERGWLIGILDGPEQTSEAVYGAGLGSEFTDSTGNPNVPAADRFYLGELLEFADIDTDNDGEISEEELDAIDFPGAADTDDIYALGFGSVAVNFEVPEQYNVLDENGAVIDNTFFVGFRDYVLNFFPAAGVVYGPTFEVSNYGAPEDGLLDDDPDDVGFADDLNGNGQTFTIVTGDLDGDGTIDDDEIIGSFTDYGDLYNFDIFFEEVSVRNITELDGIEAMLTHEISTSHKLERGRQDYLQLTYGVRYLQLNDLFSWEGRGSILGRTGADVDIENQIVGPQIGLNWTRDRGKWDFIVDGRFMFGYNVVDRGLDGLFAQGAIPGGLNNAISVRTTTRVSGDQQHEFSPVAELRLQARYKLTKAIALRLGFTSKYIGEVHRASQSMRYTVPYFTLQEGTRDVFINGIDGGVELRY